MDIFVDKNYTIENVLLDVNNTIKDYMDINKHQLGSDIYVGDIERIVGNVPGVLNVIETRIFNEYGNEYSETRTTQATVEDGEISRENSVEFDLIENQYTLNGEADEMFEIKYPERDIRIKVMRR
jgi:activator of HSP90 ATPase